MKNYSLNKERNVWLFFIITFLFSWLLWLPFVLSGFGVLKLSETISSLTTLAVMIGAFGPLVSAVILIGRKEGRIGVKKFFRQAFSFRSKLIYFAFAIFMPFLITAVAHYFVVFTGLDILPNNLFPEELTVPVIVLVVPYFLFILIAGGGQEEFGWRGFAQKPLQKQFGILLGSILLGIVWGVWHLPLWFMPGEGHAYYSFWAFLIYTMSTSVIIGWLYNASGKKLVVAWIFHAAGNVAVPFFPIMHMANVPQPGYWVWVSVSTFVAICVSVWYTKKLRRNPTLFESE